jgi:hypothetical protein
MVPVPSSSRSRAARTAGEEIEGVLLELRAEALEVRTTNIETDAPAEVEA